MTLVDDALRLAAAHRRAGRLAEALAVYAHALEQAPAEPRLVKGLAALTAATGDPATAISLYSRALADNPQDVEALNNRGVMFLHLGDAQAAVDCLQRAAQASPQDPAVQGNLGNALLALGDGSGALAALRRAVVLAPDDARGPYNLAHAVAAVDGDAAVGEVRTLLEQALALDPDHVPARVNLANLLLRGGQMQAALDQYNAALLRDPLSGLLLHNRAHALAELGRWDAALADLAQARGLVVGAHRIDLLIGQWSYRLGRLDAALEALVRAAEARPDLSTAWLALAEVLRDQGRIEEALEVLDQVGPAAETMRAELVRLRAASQWDVAETTAPGNVLNAEGLDPREMIRLLRFVPVLEQQQGPVTVLGLGDLACLRPQQRPVDPAQAAAATSLLALPHALTGAAPPLPYLHSQPNRPRPWAAQPRGNAPRIGLVWRHAGQPTGPDQDLTLTDLLPVLEAAPGVAWVALASPITRDEDARMQELGIDNAARQARDYEDVLALTEPLDLVIGCDAPMALLAAAAGRPCWLLLPIAPRWPWGMRGAIAIDYPGMELFRQTRPLSWREPILRVVQRLKARFG